jgi:excisionase family DNA binding protein
MFDGRRAHSVACEALDFCNFSMKMEVQSEWLTATEAARYLKVKPRTILAWAKQGCIPAHKLSGSQRVTWRFLKSELDAMLTAPSAAGLGGSIEQQN